MVGCDYYYIPTGIDKKIAKHIIKNIDKFGSEEDASKIAGNVVNEKLRRSTQRWIPTDNWIAGMMAHFINEANRAYFKFDLTSWADKIQYTYYKGNGSHYSWHADAMESGLAQGDVRKLSISLLLSDPDDYEGGEFQLLFKDRREMISIKPELGSAIIFPSDALHRVRPLKGGKRVSLVGWYGGPPLR